MPLYIEQRHAVAYKRLGTGLRIDGTTDDPGRGRVRQLVDERGSLLLLGGLASPLGNGQQSGGRVGVLHRRELMPAKHNGAETGVQKL